MVLKLPIKGIALVWSLCLLADQGDAASLQDCQGEFSLAHVKTGLECTNDSLAKGMDISFAYMNRNTDSCLIDEPVCYENHCFGAGADVLKRGASYRIYPDSTPVWVNYSPKWAMISGATIKKLVIASGDSLRGTLSICYQGRIDSIGVTWGGSERTIRCTSVSNP